MAIPKYFEMYRTFLEAIQNEGFHEIGKIKEDLINKHKISDEELQKTIPSGKQSLFDNRVGWTTTYLKKAKLIDNPQRGTYYITETGEI